MATHIIIIIIFIQSHQSINQYISVRQKSWQRAGQLSLPHERND